MKIYGRLMATSCFAALLAGCVTFHPRPIAPEKTAEAFSARTLTDPGLEKFLGGAPVVWDLGGLTLAALYYHPDLDVARAQWNAARAAQRTAGEIPNPSVVWGSELYVSNAAPGVTPWIYPFSFDIPIETAGKRGIRKRQAAAQAEAARQNLIQTAWQIRSKVRTSLVAYLVAEQSEIILKHQQKELGENARLMQERSSTGRTSPLNAAQATLLSGRNRLAIEDAFRQESDARAQLAEAIGVPIKALEQVHLSSAAIAALPHPEDPLLSQPRRAALIGRPDLLALLASYAASEAALQQEIAKQYPDVHLGPGLTYDQGADKWGIGVSFPIPVFNHNQGLIREAEAHRDEAAARFLSLQDSTINQIDRTIAAYRGAYRKLQTANEVWAAQAKQNRDLRDLLRPGDVSRLTLFRSQLDIDTTELARADAFRQAQDALGALEDAMGRPLNGSLNLPAEAIEKNPREVR